MKFEIHITGKEPATIDILNIFGIKSITIELLKRDGTVFATEYMSSLVIDADTFHGAFMYASGLVGKLRRHLITVTRVKIECPYCQEMLDHSVYIEAHFKQIENVNYYPLSRNKASGKIIATDRKYARKHFYGFIYQWSSKAEIELCVLDTAINADDEWFKLFNI